MRGQPPKIISGGQTGVDRGALDAALAAKIESGGFCPAERVAEDGRIPERYPLTEIAGGYDERTARNVAESDGTLIVYFAELKGGTRFTLECCEREEKPHLVFDAAQILPEVAAESASRFVNEHAIRTLNVAGPRASEWAEGHEYARRVIELLLEKFSR